MSECDILPHISVFRINGNRFLPVLYCLGKITLGLPCHAKSVQDLSVMRFLCKNQFKAVARFGPFAALLMEEGKFLGDGESVGVFFKRYSQQAGGEVELVGKPGGLCLLKEIVELR